MHTKDGHGFLVRFMRCCSAMQRFRVATGYLYRDLGLVGNFCWLTCSLPTVSPTLCLTFRHEFRDAKIFVVRAGNLVMRNRQEHFVCRTVRTWVGTERRLVSQACTSRARPAWGDAHRNQRLEVHPRLAKNLSRFAKYYGHRLKTGCNRFEPQGRNRTMSYRPIERLRDASAP